MAVLGESNTIPVDTALEAKEIAVRRLIGRDCRGAAQGSLKTSLKRQPSFGGGAVYVSACDVSRT